MRKGIEILRLARGKNTTLSHLYMDGIFASYLLEDTIREEKVYGKTCIPEGEYKLQLNKSAGMNSKYVLRYPKFHKGMLEITGIKNFSLVFIHIGNTHSETLGCPLTGRSYDFVNGDYKVLQSAAAYQDVYRKLLGRLEKGETEIRVVNQLNL